MGLISRVSSRTYRNSFYNMMRRFLTTSVRQMSEGTGMTFTFASPAVSHYNAATNVTQVDLPTTEGRIGILPNHVPSIGTLAAGWATVIEQGGATKRVFVSSGSFSINNDGSVAIAAEEAVEEADICMDTAKKELAAAQAALASAKDDKAKAEAQIAVETLEAMTK